jgi:hemerythrin-like domain-containing protein
MRPTEILKNEHKVIKRMLQVLGVMAGRLEAGEPVDAGHLEQAVAFIRGFADRCHHGKEEDLLFAEMAAAGMPRHVGPVAVMLAEHDEGRAYVREMAAAAEAYAAGDATAGRRFAAAARGYAALLDQHIDKEDNVLYEMADARLAPAQQDALARGFARVEDELMGPGEHEKFHASAEELSRIYGVK